MKKSSDLRVIKVLKKMKRIILIFLFLCTVGHCLSTEDLDKSRSFAELIVSRGFRLLSYTVPTADGYILTLHRVVPPEYNERTYSQRRQPVIVQHGLFGSSSDFFITSPDIRGSDNHCSDNFGFCLVLTGRYDVFLPNSRGSVGTDHQWLSEKEDSQYWNFTFEQMAIYDTPAVIETIQNVTGYKKIAAIGYSQGSNIFFILFSLLPKYVSIIEPFISWAPPAIIGNMTSSARLLVPLYPILQKEKGKFSFSDIRVRSIISPTCGLSETLCAEALLSFFGESDKMNLSRLEVYLNFFPSPISNTDLSHFAQLYERKNFYRFDYHDEEQNLKAYNKKEAPLYPLENIPKKTKIYTIHGNTDALVTNSDATKFIKKLRSIGLKVNDYKVPSEKFNHFDFMVGENAGKLVYDKTIQILDKFYNKKS